ncbi:MAG: glycosyltransferase family 39 protein [bacterium]|nr:glycosyltransferase family 39 protein [bacterium]
MNRKRTFFFFLLPVLLSFLLHLHVFEMDLVGYHVWRQTQTQTVIYKFSFADNFILHPQRFDIGSNNGALLYEFPLYQWLIAQVNHIVGYSVSNTRFITFFFFLLLLGGFYFLLTKFVSKQVALLSNWCLCFSPVLYYYCVNPLPDILALCFGIWCLNFFFDFLRRPGIQNFILFCVTLCLATLVKLPYVLFGAGFAVFVVNQLKSKNYGKAIFYSAIYSLFLIPPVLWYLHAFPTWQSNKIGLGISANTKTAMELLDFLQSNLISSLPELLVNYGAFPFFMVGVYLFFKQKKWKGRAYFVFPFLVCCIYFLYELNMIEKTHDYYLMPFLPFVFLVIALGINTAYLGKYRKLSFALICLIPLLAWLRINQRWDLDKPGFNKDYLQYQHQITLLIPEKERVVVDFDDSKFIALYYLKRQGYSLYENEMNPQLLDQFYLNGAKYLITENKKFDPLQYKGLSFELLFDKGLKLYKLKTP